MGNRNFTGQCRLCLEIAELRNSHLLPKAAYRHMRRGKSRGINQVMFADQSVRLGDHQVTASLLCDSCEQRFREHGEDWVMANCYRGPGEFRFQEILERHEPLRTVEENRIWAGKGILGLDMDAVIYFACSVFWRAGTYKWSRGRMRLSPVHIELGRYLEPLRLFLLDKATFPSDMALFVRISSWPRNGKYGPLSGGMNLPESGRVEGLRAHVFSVPGITFHMLVGKQISHGLYDFCCAPFSEQYVKMIPSADREHGDYVLSLFEKRM